jgi:hypothetical protein
MKIATEDRHEDRQGKIAIAQAWRSSEKRMVDGWRTTVA